MSEQGIEASAHRPYVVWLFGADGGRVHRAGRERLQHHGGRR